MMRPRPFVAVPVSALLFAAPASAAGPVVKTTAGVLSGAAEDGLQVYRGIPYARPPVGDLRWRAPKPVTKWNGVRPATSFAASCMQRNPAPFGPYTASFVEVAKLSEDCLYLNVWTVGAGKRPVYLFIHGGAFYSGSGELAAYDGAALTRKGAVVVTINYRLGLFGFLAHRELSKESPFGTSGNYGLLDTIEALRWVRANIARFGGNPANVTIAGQSAGSGIVNELLVSPMAKGLFHRAVLESGTAIRMPMASLAEAEKGGAAAVSALMAKDIAGLRAMSTAELMQVKLPTFTLPIVDGKIIPANPEEPTTPIRSKVPTIVGYTRDDADPTSLPKTVAAFEKEVRGRYGDLAHRFLALYPHASDAEAARSGVALAHDRMVAALLLWRERTGDVPSSYAYFFERTFPGIDPARYGAFHTAEVPYIFGAMDLPDARFTAEDRAISSEMQDRWIAFMRTGNPNPSATGPQWRSVTDDPASIWRIAPVDDVPLLDAQRLDLFRSFLARGGRIGLL